MAKLVLVANWKNFPGSLEEAKDLMKEVGKKRLLYKKLSTFIAPPAPYLALVSERVRGFAQLGTQDLFPEEKGKFTGAVTPEILKSFGVRLAILGHSERRAQGETSLEVSKKIKVALKAGMMPLVCVGELSRDTDGEHFEFLQEQIKSSLSGLKKAEVSKVMLAYEPVWAIGKSAKEAIDPVDLSQTIIFMRKIIADLFGREIGEEISILYGGAVEPVNAGILIRNSGIRGFLVGHASLNAGSFEKIALAMIEK